MSSFKDKLSAYQTACNEETTARVALERADNKLCEAATASKRAHAALAAELCDRRVVFGSVMYSLDLDGNVEEFGVEVIE